MKDIKALEERIKLQEQEIATLTEEVDRVKRQCLDCERLKDDIRALLVFLERRYPEIMKELPEIVKKIKTG